MTISQHMPDAYDFGEETDLSDLSAAIDLAVANASVDIGDLLGDLGVLTADGDGLGRTGENYDTARPPGMLDSRYAPVIAIIAGGRRCTIAIIRALLDAATGLTWTVKDQQHDLDENGGAWGIPLFEIWCKATLTGDPYGLMYAGYDTHVDYHPVESGLAGPVLNALGKDGGEFNDHAWGLAPSPWVVALVERVRPVGVRVIFKDF